MNLKSIKSFGFLFLLILFSSTSIPLKAKSGDHYPTVKTLRTEIISLIKKPDLTTLNTKEESVKLIFLVNMDKEVVVINTDSNSEYLEEYIKKKLNYQKIKTNYVQFNKMYHINLIFKKK